MKLRARNVAVCVHLGEIGSLQLERPTGVGFDTPLVLTAGCLRCSFALGHFLPAGALLRTRALLLRINQGPSSSEVNWLSITGNSSVVGQAIGGAVCFLVS